MPNVTIFMQQNDAAGCKSARSPTNVPNSHRDLEAALENVHISYVGVVMPGRSGLCGNPIPVVPFRTKAVMMCSWKGWRPSQAKPACARNPLFWLSAPAIPCTQLIIMRNTAMDHIPFPSQQIGEFSITAISDGYLSPVWICSPISVDVWLKTEQDAGVSDPSSIHTTLSGARPWPHNLIDAGAGGFKQWGGKLKVNLALAGVQAFDIDTIL